MEITICKTTKDFDNAKKLTRDYLKWLNRDLSFQNTDHEFETFNKMYNTPEGCYIYVMHKGDIAGGIAVRRLDDTYCEMKRLYVYEQFRGLKLGLLLCQELFEVAKKLGYQKMRLDTVAELENAIELYKSLEFYTIPPYRVNPEKTVRYMEKEL